MKSYTDIEQSKKLAEILPLESADMHYGNFSPKGLGYENKFSAGLTSYIKEIKVYEELKEYYGIKNYNGIVAWKVIPAWSLSALLDVIPYNVTFNRGVYRFKLVKFPGYWECYHENFGTVSTNIFKANNPIDVCVSMIERLHELKIL